MARRFPIETQKKHQILKVRRKLFQDIGSYDIKDAADKLMILITVTFTPRNQTPKGLKAQLALRF